MPSAPAVLALLLLLSAPAAAGEFAALSECTEATLRVELSPEPLAPPVVCLSPGQDTVFRFSARLAPNGVVVEPAGRRLEWSASRHGLTFYTLEPASTLEDLVPGEQLTLRLLLEGPVGPVAVTFVLVVHPARATRQVQLFLGERPPSDYRQEAREATARAERCEEDRARIEAACTSPAGLFGLLGPATVWPKDFRADEIASSVTPSPRNPLVLYRLTAYRVGEQLVLDVGLHNPGLELWALAGAALIGPSREELALLPLPPAAPIEPGSDRGRVLVGAVRSKKAPLGPYTLKLWDASKRVVTISNITFP